MIDTSIRCTICASPKRHEFHRRLWAGASIAGSARDLGLPKQPATRHHRHGHVPPNPDNATSAVADTPGGDIRPLDIARAVLDDLRAMQTKGMAPKSRMDHASAVLKAASEVLRYEGGARPTTIRIDEVEGLPEFLAVMFKVLEPHPEIRLQMLEAVRAAGLEGVLG